MGERAQVARGLCRLVSSERVSSSEFRRSQEEDLQPFCQHASLMGEGGGEKGVSLGLSSFFYTRTPQGVRRVVLPWKARVEADKGEAGGDVL